MDCCRVQRYFKSCARTVNVIDARARAALQCKSWACWDFPALLRSLA